jgi:hypothetical protein
MRRVDRPEARKLLDEELARLRELGYEGLRSRVPEVIERSRRRFLFWHYDHEVWASAPFEIQDRTGDSGTLYQVETNFCWDEVVGGSVRVHTSIHDGESTICNEEFVMAPDGHLVSDEWLEGS